MLRGAALKHKKTFENYVEQAGDPNVVLRMPPVAAPLTVAERVLGKQPSLTQEYGATITLKAVVTEATSALDDRFASIPAEIAALGRTQKLDLILRLPLANALVTANAKYGSTSFDTAKDVQIGGEVFEVKGTGRSGLPPEGPYILWVALRKAGE